MFLIHGHESAMGAHVFPDSEPRSHLPLSPIPWVVPEQKTKKQGRLKDRWFFDEATHVSQNRGAGQITVLIKIKGFQEISR